jgi:hypothetical protein
MPVAALIFVLERLGDPITGLWCDRCALPSGVEIPYSLSGAGCVSVGVLRRCEDCGEPVEAA